ncbi:MAG TPA: tetratricopeptide repeat protein [Thermoanaerobaculia bacterium]|nr:tetratricopeptide repeat protein [Thermoanaerobaculia bacterium]
MSRLGRLLPPALAAAGLALALVALFAGRPGRGDDATATLARDSLARGNRLVRRGELDAALAAYTAGWGDGDGGASSATLAYNLGTTHHRLGQLPEALLWYRRALAVAPSPNDDWLRENLELARAELAAARFEPPGLGGRLAAHPVLLTTAAVVLAWLALTLYLARRRLALSLPPAVGEWAWAAVAGIAFATWAAVFALSAWGPRPAVLLAPCGPELAAGSEVWVTPAGEEGWSVAGGAEGRSCPESVVGRVGG